MKTILLDYRIPTQRFDALSICLGYFDGVHLGHQALIKYARKYAKYTLGLLTFSKPISTYVDNGKNVEVLSSLDDRFKIISTHWASLLCRNIDFFLFGNIICKIFFSIMQIIHIYSIVIFLRL